MAGLASEDEEKKVRLNLGCWVYYIQGWVNVDLATDVKTDLREDCETLPSFISESVDEIYAGHLLEHVQDVAATLRRWRELLKPGGRLTITVPDCEGATALWAASKRFPVLGCDSTSGILAVATGYTGYSAMAEFKAAKGELQTHRRVFDRSTLRICLEHAGFAPDSIREVDSHECMPASVKDCGGWQMAFEAVK